MLSSCYRCWHGHRSVWQLLPFSCTSVSEIWDVLLLKIHGDSFDTAMLIACFSTGNIIIQVIMALSFSAFCINGVCVLYALIYIG